MQPLLVMVMQQLGRVKEVLETRFGLECEIRREECVGHVKKETRNRGSTRMITKEHRLLCILVLF